MNESQIFLRCRKCLNDFKFDYDVWVTSLGSCGFRIIYPKFCTDCHTKQNPAKVVGNVTYPGRDGRPISQEDCDGWKENYYATSEYFVYILSMSSPEGYEFYIGHTGNIHTRVQSHLNGWDDRTKGKNPKLVWFCEVATREEATRLEAELKGVNEQNSDIIKEMVLSFKHLAGQLDYTAL